MTSVAVLPNTAAHGTVEQPDATVLTTEAPPILLVLVGLVGSGKSTLAQALSDELGWIRVCQDDLGDRKTCEDRVHLALTEGKNVVVDRVNFDRKQRSHFLAIAEELGYCARAWCIILDVPKEILIQRLTARTDHPTIKDLSQALQVLGRMSSIYRPPSPYRTEGFEKIYYLKAHHQPSPETGGWNSSALTNLLGFVERGTTYPRQVAMPERRPPTSSDDVQQAGEHRFEGSNRGRGRGGFNNGLSRGRGRGGWGVDNNGSWRAGSELTNQSDINSEQPQANGNVQFGFQGPEGQSDVDMGAQQ